MKRALLVGFMMLISVAPADAVIAPRPVLDYQLPNAQSWMLDQERVFANIKAPGSFPIDILPITTSRGTPDVTVANAEVIINRVSKVYETLSNGTIKLTLRSVLPVKEATGSMRTPVDVQTLHGKIAVNYTDGSVLIGVMIPDNSLGYSGIATLGGSVMLVNSAWSTSSRTLTNTIAHEFGHNLGLNHSGYAVCTGTNLNSCEMDEYGDGSDFMGRFIPGYVTDPPHLRLSAWHLNKLGLLAADAVSTISVSGTYELAPVYGGSGVRLLVIPVYNAPGYAIEYRPPSGQDSMLAERRLNIPGMNSYYTNDPSYGVQVRALQQTSDASKTMLPISKYGPSVSILGTDWNAVQGLQAGQALALPDGTSISVLATDPSRGARVTVTITPDTTAPTAVESTVKWSFGDADAYKVWANDWPNIYFDNRAIDDNRKVASVVMEVNGTEVARENNPGPGSITLEYTPKVLGTFKVKGIIRDISGNQITTERTLTSIAFQHPKTKVQLRAGKPAKSVIEVIYTPPWSGWTFSITSSAGKVGVARKVGASRVVAITGLKAGQSVKVSVLGTDEEGNTDGGQTLTRRTASK